MDVRLTTVGSTRFLTNPNDNYVSKSLEVYGEWSHGEVLLFSKLLHANSNVVEIGANIGAHTVFIARDVCGSGTVYAFEPRRLLFQMLCANIVLNGLTNVYAFPLAAGSKAGTMTEGTPPTSENANFGAFALGALKGEGETIEITPLDEMIDSIKPIAMLKIDVEGWEHDVLAGAQKIIARDRPFLYVENDRVEKSHDLITSIQQMKYNLWWHIVPLFRPNNHAHTRVNIFGKISSFNMLCLPQESKVSVTNLPRIDDADYHPLRKPATELAK